MPMSWMPVVTSARPSASRRIDACAGGPPPPHQICVAHPIPRRSPSEPARRVRPVRPPGELGCPVVAREQPLARIRGKPRALVERRRGSPAQLERIQVEPRGELVHRLVEHRHPLHHTGRPKRVLRPKTRLDGEDHRPDVRAGVEPERRLPDREDPAPGPHLHHGCELDPSRVPSRLAPSVTVWRVQARRPPTSCVPVARERQAHGADPRPAPARPRGAPRRLRLVSRRSRRRCTPRSPAPARFRARSATQAPAAIEHPGSRSSEPIASQRATAAAARAASGRVRVSHVSSTRTSAPASAPSGSPPTVSRGSSVNRLPETGVEAEGASFRTQRERRDPLGLASRVSAATAAMGAPPSAARPGGPLRRPW